MSRKNVAVQRTTSGLYILANSYDDAIVELNSYQWGALGLKPLAKGQTAVVDLQVSGIPKRKRKGRK